MMIDRFMHRRYIHAVQQIHAPRDNAARVPRARWRTLLIAGVEGRLCVGRQRRAHDKGGHVVIDTRFVRVGIVGAFASTACRYQLEAMTAQSRYSLPGSSLPMGASAVHSRSGVENEAMSYSQSSGMS